MTYPKKPLQPDYVVRYGDPRVYQVALPGVGPPLSVCALCAAVVVDIELHFMELHSEGPVAS